MADEGIFATTAEVARKAGTDASATSVAEAYVNQYMTEAESLINSITTFNWSDAYSGLDVDTKAILKTAASAWAAISVIRWDMKGFSGNHATTMINSLLLEWDTAIKELKLKDTQEFIKNV